MTTDKPTRHPHGHHNRYYVGGCRCAECKAAAAAYTKFRRAALKGKAPESAHGTRKGYTGYGCRCDACVTANAEYLKSYRKRPGATEQHQRNKRKWIAANPERHAENARRSARNGDIRRKTLIRNGDMRLVTERDWQRLCARHGNCCFYCGEAKPLTMDHIIPIARGGRHSIGNLIPACRNCNAQKRTRLIVEWRFIKSQAA